MIYLYNQYLQSFEHAMQFLAAKTSPAPLLIAAI